MWQNLKIAQCPSENTALAVRWHILYSEKQLFLLSLLSCVWQVVGTDKGVAVIHYDYSHPLHEHAMCSAICSHVDYLRYKKLHIHPAQIYELVTAPEWKGQRVFCFSPFDSPQHCINAKGTTEMLLVMIRSLNNVSINMEGKRRKIGMERRMRWDERNIRKDGAGGSGKIMGGSGSALAFVIPHSTTIYKRVSQNTCCGIVFSGLPHRKDFCEPRKSVWENPGMQRVISFFTVGLLGAFYMLITSPGDTADSVPLNSSH